MKKVITVFGTILFASTILTSCGGGTSNKEINSKDSTSINSDSSKNAKERIPDKDAIADAILDEVIPENEKTKVSYINSKNINDGFGEAIKGLKRIENKKINEMMIFELYKQQGNQEGPEWEFKAVIRIGDYYLPIILGIDHSIKIQDLVYNDNMQEIIINTGCFSDAGCLDKRMIVRTFKMRPFTLTDFDASEVYLTEKDLDGYSFPGDKEKLSAVLNSKELIIITRDYKSSQLVIQSYKPYKLGFAKGSLTKKLKVELAG